jgi:hypothetical protein
VNLRQAPEWQVAEWLNSNAPLTLDDFRARTLVALAFQMLCPGCVAHALPPLQRVRELFPPEQVAVVALHSVFEHHDAQGRPEVLRAFLHENRIRVPVAIDQPGDDRMPLTFSAYAMQGTPTLMLIDASGRLRMQTFGHVDDMRLGAYIASIVAEARIDAAGAAT